MTETNLLAIVGSLRSGSVNRATAQAASELAPDGTTIKVHEIDTIPMYNEDVESVALPESVIALQAAVAEADGIVFFLPEYNGSLPAVSKNVIDWLSRPPKSIEGKAVAGVATTPGGRAGESVLTHFEQIFDYMIIEVRRFDSFGIGKYFEKFSGAPELEDEETRADLQAWLGSFVEFVRA